MKITTHRLYESMSHETVLTDVWPTQRAYHSGGGPALHTAG